MLEFNEVKVLDRNSEALGVPTSTLMENAGKGVANFIIDRFIASKRIERARPEIIIFCGPGNNGGDGYVTARYLKKAAEVTIILTAPAEKIRTVLARDNYEKVKSELKVVKTPPGDEVKSMLTSADLVVDAMLGVGLTGELREPYLGYTQAIEESGLPVVSVDAPTGLGTNKSLKPTFTVTFHDSKVGMTEENSGEIAIIPIGIPDEAERFIGPGELIAYYPHPADSSHKGQNGRLLIVGGGPYTGAPALAGLAALRTGVDLVHIATPTRCMSVIAGFSPNFIVHELAGAGGDIIVEADCDKILELSEICDAIVLGPGVGRDPATFNCVRKILAKSSIPIVLDADGLSAVEPDNLNEEEKPEAGWIITPHYTEFIRLSGGSGHSQSKKPEHEELEAQCKQLSSKLGAVIVLKGQEDIVCDTKSLKINRTGNPGMTVGGTGDVLAGIVGALAAKQVDLFNAARIGVYLNGYAGDMAWSEKGPGLLATDIIDHIPGVLKKFI